MLGLTKKLLKNRKLIRNAALFVLTVGLVIAGILLIWVSSLRIPDFSTFDERKVVNSTKIYDRTGQILLYDIHKDVRRTNIGFESMGDNIKKATVAIEDSEFYNHSGIRLTSIFRATILAKLTGKRLTGGSTITQQLIKNTLLTAESTFVKKVQRKMKEWVLALKMEKQLSKEQILELYLNEIPYGGTIYGIQEASTSYFGKKPADLTLAESAYLASIPQSPTVLSPYGKNRAKLDDRKNLVLSRMFELKIITEEDYNQAKAEVVVFSSQTVGGIKAPHFVFFIKEYLEEKYGTEVVERGGLKVISTLDYNLEAKAEAIVKEGALKNEKDWGGENASLVAIDPRTGQILTMVGSRDYFDKEIDGNFNIATASRQPGSSFKPFIYATAFTKGFTPQTVLFDLPTEFQASCSPYGGDKRPDCYMPQNYDGKFRGPMTLRNALAQSINIPAVKLFYLSGLNDSLKTAEDMGISTLNEVGRYGLTLVIGGGEVTLLDMTSAYAVFANSGVRNSYTGILKIEDSKGKLLEEYQQNSKEVILKNTALTISDILSDNNARVPTFGANSPLVVPGGEVAVKTGTTNSNKDAWTVGYTPSIAVGVWAGNNDNKSMKKGGAALAGPMWNKFMKEALSVLPNEQFEKPDYSGDYAKKPVLRGSWMGNETYFVDRVSGGLAGPNTPEESKEEKTITNVHSILYWVNKKDILGPPPVNPASDPQFSQWEIPVQRWWSENYTKYPINTVNNIPTTVDNIHNESTKPIISISASPSLAVYGKNQEIRISVAGAGAYPLQKINMFVNGTFLGSLSSPFNFSITPSDVHNLRLNNELKVVGYDTIQNVGEGVFNFQVSQ